MGFVYLFKVDFWNGLSMIYRKEILGVKVKALSSRTLSRTSKGSSFHLLCLRGLNILIGFSALMEGDDKLFPRNTKKSFA